jgi:nitrate reductase molybdenum cofactor assembly chaperone NarJ/NarW
MKRDQRAVAARAASVLLRYPDAEVLDTLPTVRAALADLPAAVAGPLAAVAGHLAAGDPRDLAADYVDTFDFRRRCSLHLTYFVHGDTRARGRALAELAGVYRAAGFAIGHGELPDHLPTVLELAARAGEPGWQLLHAHRIGLDLLSAALERAGSPYASALAGVRGMLPPPGPGDDAAAAHLAATGPPAEMVGLDPFPTLAADGGRR